MNYHDTRFARQLGETPLRPDYASAIERHTDYSPAWYVWVAAIAVVSTFLIVWTA
jgi:hypothetical protein